MLFSKAISVSTLLKSFMVLFPVEAVNVGNQQENPGIGMSGKRIQWSELQAVKCSLFSRDDRVCGKVSLRADFSPPTADKPQFALAGMVHSRSGDLEKKGGPDLNQNCNCFFLSPPPLSGQARVCSCPSHITVGHLELLLLPTAGSTIFFRKVKFANGTHGTKVSCSCVCVSRLSNSWHFVVHFKCKCGLYSTYVTAPFCVSFVHL